MTAVLEQLRPNAHSQGGAEVDQRLRIAFYSPRTAHLEPAVARGGDPIFLRALLGALRSRGHSVEVVSLMNVRDLWRGRIPAHRLVTEAIAVRKEIKRLAPDGWIVYNTSRTYPDLFGWWQRPRRYVLLAAQTWQSKRLPRRWRLLFAFAYRRSLSRADWVTATRPDTAERLRRRGVPAERLVVLQPAVALPAHVPTQRAARQRLGLPLDDPVVLCISRFTQPGSRDRKTEIVLDLLASVASLPEKPLLVIVGDGPGRAEIEARASDIRPEDRVRLFPPVPNDELVWFYAACDVYAYPDLIDLPRLSVLEAQACGRPVLTMRTPSSESTVSDGRTGVLAHDLVEFRTHLGELLADRARRETMGRAALDFVATRHSIELRATQVESLLRSR
jgi:glycosyltransferase involved in cell wall biosynthesis